MKVRMLRSTFHGQVLTSFPAGSVKEVDDVTAHRWIKRGIAVKAPEVMSLTPEAEPEKPNPKAESPKIEAPKPVEEISPTIQEGEDLQYKTKVELFEMAKALGLPITSRMTKSELLDVLEKGQ